MDGLNEEFDLLNPDETILIIENIEKDVKKDFENKELTTENVKDYLNDMGFSISEEYLIQASNTSSVSRYIYLKLQERKLHEKLTELVKKELPSVDVEDCYSFYLPEDLSSTVIFRKRDEDKENEMTADISCLELRYFYDYESNAFMFRVFSKFGRGIVLSLSQIQMLLGKETESKTSDLIDVKNVPKDSTTSLINSENIELTVKGVNIKISF